MRNKYYKYRNLYLTTAMGREVNPYTKAIFEQAQIYYATPKDCNDPFDCNLRLHVKDSTDQEWEAYIEKLCQSYPAQEEALRQTIEKKLWRTDPSIVDSCGSTQKTHYEESSLFCFSRVNNSIPMFSYYADGHKGVAIEFEFDDTEMPCGIPFGDPNDPNNLYQRMIIVRDVEYSQHLPELNYHRLYNASDHRLVRSLLFTKAHEWSHEKEFRIFRRKVPASTVQFERRLLTRVILGCRTTNTELELVRQWLQGWPTDVVISKANLAPDKFELIISDIETVKAT